MADDKKAFQLRIPVALWRDIEAWAAADLRSVNGQIEYLLREALRQRGIRSQRPDADSAGGLHESPKVGSEVSVGE